MFNYTKEEPTATHEFVWDTAPILNITLPRSGRILGSEQNNSNIPKSDKLHGREFDLIICDEHEIR